MGTFMRRSIPPNEMALQSGSLQYEGFLKDLLDLLAKDLEFDYFIEEETIHGFLNSDGNWTGLIGSLVDRVRIHLHFLLVASITRFFYFL